MTISEFARSLFRTKKIDSNLLDTQLKRCLTTFDITLLGIGHMVGAGIHIFINISLPVIHIYLIGIYVLTGAVVRNIAGAGIVISFILAGLASALSALCYAEFG